MDSQPLGGPTAATASSARRRERRAELRQDFMEATSVVTPAKKLVGPEEAATALGISKSWLDKRIRERSRNGIPVIYIGDKPRFDLNELIEWARNNPPRSRKS